jgi:hypothetical protein
MRPFDFFIRTRARARATKKNSAGRSHGVCRVVAKQAEFGAGVFPDHAVDRVGVHATPLLSLLAVVV